MCKEHVYYSTSFRTQGMFYSYTWTEMPSSICCLVSVLLSSFWTWNNKLHLLGWQSRSMLGLYWVSAREKMKGTGFFFFHIAPVVDEGKVELGHASQTRCSPESLCKELCWIQLWVCACLWWSTIGADMYLVKLHAQIMPLNCYSRCQC